MPGGWIDVCRDCDNLDFCRSTAGSIPLSASWFNRCPDEPKPPTAGDKKYRGAGKFDWREWKSRFSPSHEYPDPIYLRPGVGYIPSQRQTWGRVVGTTGRKPGNNESIYSKGYKCLYCWHVRKPRKLKRLSDKTKTHLCNPCWNVFKRWRNRRRAMLAAT